jgi:hypothetical protein
MIQPDLRSVVQHYRRGKEGERKAPVLPLLGMFAYEQMDRLQMCEGCGSRRY